jgi:hypothetical protein
MKFLKILKADLMYWNDSAFCGYSAAIAAKSAGIIIDVSEAT